MTRKIGNYRMSPTPSMEPTETWRRPRFSVLSGGISAIPAPLTSLIGRERELATAQALIVRQDIRMLTLTGPGGIGKTRIALQLAADLADAFADGVRFVPLESVRNAGQVAAAIATAVNVQSRGGEDMLDVVASVLQRADMLLVVDNFEHVLAAAPVLTALLKRCPKLTMLVTSQVLLRVSGEHTLAIPPLALPGAQSSLSTEGIAGSAAIQLFGERVQAVDVTFEISETTAPLVAEICRRLDGLPLAIELVAPRVRHLSLPDLLVRLDRRLPLLTGGSRDKPSRLQTMRNAIAWSFDLLTPREQIVVRCLAIFAGGFTLEAAEQVVGDGHGEDGLWSGLDFFDDLGTLIDASLLQTELSITGTVRYRMLETIREFALERLEASGQAAQIRDAHAACFLALAEEFNYAFLPPDSHQHLTRLQAEHANLLVAFDWFEESGQFRLLLRFAAALGRFWPDLGHYHEGHERLERALSHNDELAADRASALISLGFIKIYLGLAREAESTLVSGLVRSRQEDDTINEGRALMGLGALANLEGDFVHGETLLRECIAVARTIPNQRTAGNFDSWAHNNLAVIARGRADYTLAYEHLNHALSGMRDAGNLAGIVMCLGDLGDLARDQGDHVRALEQYREGLELSHEHAHMVGATYLVEAVGILAINVGQAEHGVRLLGAAEAMRERSGLRFRVAENVIAMESALTEARTTLTEQTLAAAWEAGRQLGAEQVIDLAIKPFSLPAASVGRAPGAAGLTPRETEIAHLVAAGQTDAAIAATLFISVRTVENHVAHILAKLGVHTRAAVGRAMGSLSDPLPPV